MKTSPLRSTATAVGSSSCADVAARPSPLSRPARSPPRSRRRRRPRAPAPAGRSPPPCRRRLAVDGQAGRVTDPPARATAAGDGRRRDRAAASRRSRARSAPGLDRRGSARCRRRTRPRRVSSASPPGASSAPGASSVRTGPRRPPAGRPGGRRQRDRTPTSGERRAERECATDGPAPHGPHLAGRRPVAAPVVGPVRRRLAPRLRAIGCGRTHATTDERGPRGSTTRRGALRRQRHAHRHRRRADQRVPGPARRRRPVRRRPGDPPPARVGLGHEGDHPALRRRAGTTPSAPTSTPARASMSTPTTRPRPPARPVASPTSSSWATPASRSTRCARCRRRTARSASSATARAAATPSSPRSACPSTRRSTATGPS